jgi:ribosomal protein S7
VSGKNFPTPESPISDLVIKDLQDRTKLGISKYGQALTKHTKEDMIQHLYEELLDAAQYIRTIIEIRKDGGYGR